MPAQWTGAWHPVMARARSDALSRLIETKRGREGEGEAAEAHKAQADERIVNPEQPPDEGRQRRKMCPQIDHAWHHQARTQQPEVKKAGDLKQKCQRGCFHNNSSSCADGAE